MQALSSGVEVLRVARKISAGVGFPFAVASLDGEEVAASNGLCLAPNLPVAQVNRDDIVLVVSGAGADETENSDMVAQIRRWARHGVRVWALSSGVIRLAQAQLLTGRKVAAHWEDAAYLAARFPGVKISSALFIHDDRHATCAGGNAAAEFLMDYLARRGSGELVDEIAARLMLDGIRDGRLNQNRPFRFRYQTTNKTVFAALKLMEEHVFDKLSINEIAARLQVTQRHLERLFQANFGSSPAKVYAELRLNAARQEVLHRRRPILDIAQDYGYSRGTFSKAYKRAFGVAPSHDQKSPISVRHGI
ncbi:MAG: helix-turn-helix domain-containing protein [Rhodobacteraceae bacterium]|nr:helix-turn-helix domain-containing protein [Paracoccaceae bacterium]